MTHEGELRRPGPLLDAFFEQIGGLGEKLGALLVQLPPSQAFNSRVAGTFLSKLRERYAGPGCLRAAARHVVRDRAPNSCSFSTASREWRPIHRGSRRRCTPGGWLPTRCRPANLQSSTTACTDHRASIGRVTQSSASAVGERNQHAAGGHRRLVHLRQHRQRCRHRECTRDDGTALAPQQTTAVPLTETMSMPLFCPSTS